MPTYWPVTVRHRNPSQAQHSTQLTSPSRIPTTHPVAALQEAYNGAVNLENETRSATPGLSPTAAIFPQHLSGAPDLSGTPHGTTPPILSSARQVSLQDPLPVMQMTVRDPKCYAGLLLWCAQSRVHLCSIAAQSRALYNPVSPALHLTYNLGVLQHMVFPASASDLPHRH